jgi:GNAT superfamily N-acetyltransferase
MAIKKAALTGDGAVAATRSGTQLRRITATEVQPFRRQLGLGDGGLVLGDAALGAFEDIGTVIGVGVLTVSVPRLARAWIGVSPERRRLGVAGDLLAILVREANERGLRYLTCIHTAGDLAPVRLARSLGLAPSRRVSAGSPPWLFPSRSQAPETGPLFGKSRGRVVPRTCTAPRPANWLDARCR